MPTSKPIAITRRPAQTLVSQCELTHIPREAIDFAALQREHESYCMALQGAGAELTQLDSLPAYPDSVFVEDTAVVLDEVLVLTRPGSPSREAEPAELAAAFAPHRSEVRLILAPGRLDGGDVLRIGRRLWVGLSTRTNALGIEQLRTAVAPFGYRVEAVTLGASLHLKTACTALDDETLLFNPSWVDGAKIDVKHRIACDPSEPFAANVLRVGATVIVNAAFPRTLELLDGHLQSAGLPHWPVMLREFGKAEAGLTCLSLVFARTARAAVDTNRR
jgi:dimethylargininase